MEVFSGDTLTPFAFTCIALGSSIAGGLCAHFLAAASARLGLVSRHRRDRFSSRKVPLAGGPALAAGCVAALLALDAVPEPGWIVAVTGFFTIGLVDDLFELKPAIKLILQVAMAVTASLMLAASAGHVGLLMLLFLFLVNASNYLDNMDGLLPGVALVQALFLLFFSSTAGTGAALLTWALPGILFLNLAPARVYLGDSGSHLVGALLAVDAAGYLIGPHGAQVRYVIPLLLLFLVPIADVATVTTSRLRRKRPIFRGGTDHLSHRLVRIGFPVPRAVLILVLASAVCGASALFVLHS